MLLAVLAAAVLSPRALASPPLPPPVVTGHWAKPELIGAYEMGLIDAWPVELDRPASRRQAARLLADGLGLVPSEGELPLADVSGSDPDRPWFVAMYNEGVFRGDDRGLLRPDEPLTRAEFAAVLARSAGGILAETRSAPAFLDTHGHWAADEIDTAFRLGLVNGVGEGQFDPERAVTYAETLAMIVRMIEGVPAAGAELAGDDVLTRLAVLDLELWARAYSQTPVPDWEPVYANRIGVALYIMKEAAAVEDAYRRQGHAGVASVLSADARVVVKRPLSAVVTVESTGISVWDGVAEQIHDVSNVYMRRQKGRWAIYKSLGE